MNLNVIKIGGNVINDAAKLSSFLQDFSKLQDPSILVHGGGKVATAIAAKLGVETTMIGGRRITDADTIDIVTMVYGGKINKGIVAQLQSLGCNAMGLTGADGAMVKAVKRPVKEIDYGFVGDVKKVNERLIHSLLEQGISPVFAPLSFSMEHGVLNTNADTMASEIASAMGALYEVKLIYCFEKKGVLRNITDDNSVIPEIDSTTYKELKADGKIFEGMIPKLDNCFDALDRGIKKVIICHADDLLSSVEKMTAGTRLIL